MYILLILITLVSHIHGEKQLSEGLRGRSLPELPEVVSKLPKDLRVCKKGITLSGFSSGGTFAQILQFSYSSMFHGIAVFSSAFYRCGKADGNMDHYDKVCTATNLTMYDTDLVEEDIKDYFSSGLIDDPKSLKNRYLYVFTGLKNFLFSADQSLGTLKVYDRYIKNPDRIQTRIMAANHYLPTKNKKGSPCKDKPDLNGPFIGNCGINGPFEALTFMYGKYRKIREKPEKKFDLLKRLKVFDQTEFLGELDIHNMDDVGYYYVPTLCEKRKKQCLVHFYFHGCLTGREFIGTDHIKLSGYLEIAEASNIIMIFPQAKSSKPENEVGCWDTFGLSGEYYATQKGDQVMAVKLMVDRIMGIKNKD